jgi:membrane-bound lytic murein transglycosylase B
MAIATVFFVAASSATAHSVLPVSDAAFSGRLGGLSSAFLKEARSFRPMGLRDDLAYRLVSERLRGSGVPDSFLRGAFSDPGVTVDQRIIDRFNRPAEGGKLTWEQYRGIFMKPARIKRGADFYAEHKALVDAIASDTGVDKFVFLSIAGVESYYGRHHGVYTVFNALYTAIHGVPKRRTWAAKELAAYLNMSWRERFPPHSIKGSYAGAFGYTQFIPTSWEAYSVDRDGDGVREPYEWADALASTANYLIRNGYRPNDTDYGRGGSIWKAIYAYNHHDFYVRVVLEFREALEKEVEARSGPAF